MLEPSRHIIDLWLVNDREVTDPALLDRYRQLLNAEETGRHQRFIFSLHRRQFLVGRALVRTVLARYLGDTDPAGLVFLKNDHGKPLLAAQTPLQFNLTHTNGLVALAVTQQEPVGIDVEFLSRQADIVSLAKRYFAEPETAALYDLPVEDWNQRFYDLWTLKEAYLKASGTGLSTPLGAFSFSLNGSSIGISFSDGLNDDPGAWRFWQLAVEGDFRLSLAVNDADGNDWKIRARKGIPLGEFAETTVPVLRQSQGPSSV